MFLCIVAFVWDNLAPHMDWLNIEGLTSSYTSIDLDFWTSMYGFAYNPNN
jgi:hypothetical protein